jgi:hypothetical protein
MRALSRWIVLSIAVVVALPIGSASAVTFGPFMRGYLLAGADGGVFAFGAQRYEGSLANTQLPSPIVAIVPNVTDALHGNVDSRQFGYLLVSRTGQVRAFGAMKDRGDLSGVQLRAPIVAAGPVGLGYELVDAAGDVYTFVGTGAFHEVPGPTDLTAPIVAFAPGRLHGYWLLDSTGRVYPFGGAPFLGDLRATSVPAPTVGIVSDDHQPGTGDGYVIASADGTVYPFGQAQSDGDMHGRHLNAPMVGIGNLDSHGYYLVAKDGGIFAFGDGGMSPFLGSMGGRPLNAPVVAIAATGFSNETF